MSVPIGIDLGTTNCAVAQIDSHGKPVVIPNAEDNPITPSVICFTNDGIVFGDEAKDMQKLGMYPTAVFFKLMMGDATFAFDANGKSYSATDLSAILLEYIKKVAEEKIGSPIHDVVITVPAYFRDPERKATIAAGEAAGLNVLQIVNEPTAAAMAYGLKTTDADKTILVYDLGGGTFDVTLLRYGATENRIINSSGDHKLGGRNWDLEIMSHLATLFKNEFGINPEDEQESVADLYHLAEETKKRLSSSASTTVSFNYGGQRGKYELSRATFNEITAHLMEKTVALTNLVLQEAGVEAGDLDGILLVGGSTRMPMVHDFIRERFGKEPMTGVNVDEAVAQGAALLADEILRPALKLGGRRKTVDVTNHSLGAIGLDAAGEKYINSIILPKNSTLPSVDSRPFQHRTAANRDNLLEIFMTQGENETPDAVTYLGKYVVKNVPHHSGQTTLDITYSYDASGTVDVSVVDRASGGKLPVVVEPLPEDIPERFMLPPEKAVVPEHITVYLAFDLSGSMSGRPLEEARDAARSFVANMDLAHSSVGIIGFSDRVAVLLEASQNGNKINKAIDQLQVGLTGGANSGEPFPEINALLTGVSGARFGVVLADGVWSSQGRAIANAARCHQEGIETIAIGFGGADREFLKKIASSDDLGIFTTQAGLTATFSSIAQVLVETGGAGRGPGGGKFSLGMFK